MDEEQYNASRHELLQRFKDSLRKPLSERYFDEDELIAIFDDAGDMNDDYIRLEVITVAARFYPDSDALNQRRCLIYGLLSAAAGKQMLENTPQSDSPMWDILRLVEQPELKTSAIQDRLNDILDSASSMDDEEVVQIIRAAADLNQSDWVLKNVKRLSAKCRNRKLVLMEGAIALESAQRYKDAAKLMSDLVEEDPFNVGNWVMLAQQYLAMGDDEQFNQAIDYALALQPDDWQALLAKGKYLLDQNQMVDGVEALTQAARKADTSEPLRVLIYAFRCLNMDEQAEEACRMVLHNFPADADLVIPDIITFYPPDIHELLERYYRSNSDNSEHFWRTWADKLFDSGYEDAALAVLGCYTEQMRENTASLVPTQVALRRNIDPEHVLQLLEIYKKKCEDFGEALDYPSYCAIKMLCLARTGRMEDAMEFYLVSNYDPPELYSVHSKLALSGAKSLITKIVNGIKKGKDRGYFNTLTL